MNSHPGLGKRNDWIQGQSLCSWQGASGLSLGFTLTSSSSCLLRSSNC